MDARLTRTRSPPGQRPHISPPPAPDSDLKDQFKRRIEDIQRRRDQAAADMTDRLYAMIVAYKEADQGMVDEHVACLAQFSSLFPDAINTYKWAKPCIGVPEREYFAQRGIAFTYHPATDRYGLGQRGPPPEEKPSSSPDYFPQKPSHRFKTLPFRSPSPLSSTLSSVPPSPEHTLASEDKASAPENQDTRPAKRSAEPSSSDELASEPPQPAPPKPKRPRGPPETPGRKPLPTSRRPRPATPSQQPNEAPPPLPSRSLPPPAPPNTSARKIYPGPRCIECSKRKKACDRDLPCSRCVGTGRAERCRYSQKRVPR
ncbi:hypothetical protein B0T18DRAFT_402435 [Schizothecium vesticola]|uniref:Zn(2)-C6 fungal-type domain-containing protein n=1 Tax=Schizothecium vesticola TaxID=314040 RepID=A0AA40F5V0_9PEZI|nr:hypothetical protein B0T18DRAFT_402435 [Schizothecium vesticola]